MSILTPPASQSSFSDNGSEYGGEIPQISLSTTFYPRDDDPCDVIIVTCDSIFFAVQKAILLAKSNNSFGGFLVKEDCLSFVVEEDAAVFNLILFAFYEYDPTKYKPSLSQLAGMLTGLPKYGLPLPGTVDIPGGFIYNAILNTALASPLEAYALVCSHNLEQLAVQISHHLLSTPLHQLTDDLCIQMGPKYLRRLIFLHMGRTERLKLLVKEPPVGHEPTRDCDEIDQKRMLLANWREAASTLCWSIGPDTPISLLRDRLSNVANKLACSDCKVSAKERLRKLIVDWTLVKSTI